MDTQYRRILHLLFVISFPLQLPQTHRAPDFLEHQIANFNESDLILLCVVQPGSSAQCKPTYFYEFCLTLVMRTVDKHQTERWLCLRAHVRRGPFFPVDAVVLIEKKQFEDKLSRKVIETREQAGKTTKSQANEKGKRTQEKEPQAKERAPGTWRWRSAAVLQRSSC